MNKARIAVVDDEPDLRSAIGRYLSRNEFEVFEAEDGAALRSLVQDQSIDLVILDLTMPGEDGLSLARFLHASADAGIIILTGNSDPLDRILGLEIGADDYVSKPFNMRELLARARAVLRRRSAARSMPLALAEAVPVGRFLYLAQDRRLVDLSGSPVPLSPKEADLLHLFASRPGQVVTRDDVLDLIGEPEMEPFSRAVDARVARLRRKIEVDPVRPLAIRTVHGQGYMFVATGRNTT